MRARKAERSQLLAERVEEADRNGDLHALHQSVLAELARRESLERISGSQHATQLNSDPAGPSCSGSGMLCFDPSVTLCVIDENARAFPQEQAPRKDIRVGQPLPWRVAPLNTLQAGTKIVSYHLDAAGEWIYATATITKMHTYRCPSGVAMMTNLQGALLTCNHEVRRPVGEEGQKGRWMEQWFCASEDMEAQTTLQPQIALVNLEASRPHGILLGNRYLAKTLSTSADTDGDHHAFADPL